MELLVSNYPPLNSAHKGFQRTWLECFKSSDELKIAVGYASTESVLYLTSMLERNPGRKMTLCVGMAGIDGLFKAQVIALRKLDERLRSENIGGVFVPYQFPFHGKVQTFSRDRSLFAALIGSSNLSNIVAMEGQHRGNYEMDALIEDIDSMSHIDSLINSLTTEASEPLLDALDHLRINPDSNPMLNEYSKVEKVSEAMLKDLDYDMEGDIVDIPIKTHEKSHLNVFFGKGRDNGRGYIAPRHWYESEIIIDGDTRSRFRDYSELRQFIAVTDDGYKFVMMTQGDFGKNLRTRDDLTALGRWLKGRLEVSGALVVGEPVTDEVLSKYGRSTFTLSRTSQMEFDPESDQLLRIWKLDFGVGQ